MTIHGAVSEQKNPLYLSLLYIQEIDCITSKKVRIIYFKVQLETCTPQVAQVPPLLVARLTSLN